MEEISLEETNKIRKSLGLAPIQPESKSSSAVSDGSSVAIGSKSGDNDDDASSISVDQTNKIRAELGLPLIEAANEPVKNDEHENWLALKDQEHKNREHDRIRKKVQEIKEKAERRKQLDQEKGIAEQIDDTADSKSWLKKFRQKKRAINSIEDEDENEDENEKSSKYDAENLKGMKLAHSLKEVGSLKSGAILTLKDKSVLDGEDDSGGELDELESADLLETKKLKENLDLKKGKSKLHNGYDDELSHSNGLDNDGDDFVILDGSGIKVQKQTKPDDSSNADPFAGTRMKDSIDFEEFSNNNNISSDYQQAPVKFKKFKVKKSNSSAPKRRRLDDNDESENYKIDDDDDDLQNILGSARRKILRSTNKKKKIVTAEEVAEKLSLSKDAVDEDAPDGVVVSTTTDFLGIVRHAKEDESAGSGLVPTDDKRKTDEPVPVSVVKTDTVMEPVADAESDVNMVDDTTSHASVNSVSTPEVPVDLAVGGGLADALKIIQSKGITKKLEQDEEDAAQVKARQEWKKKLEKRKLELIIDFDRRKLAAREKANFNRLGVRERDAIIALEKEQFENEWAKVSQEVFADYKPNVNLEYHDEDGNVLSTKDAYKHLSHHFHGNKSGKKKIERQLKKQAEEKRKEAQSIFDVNTTDTKDRKTPGIRLQ